MTVNELLIPVNVREAMRKYYDQIHLMASDADVRRARRQLITAHAMYTKAQNEVEAAELPYRQKMAEMKPYIEQNALEVESSFSFAGVDIKYRKGYPSVSYDKDILDALTDSLRAEGNHKIAERILEARRSKDVLPSAKVVTE